ncbi:MAG: hypothetical protein KDK39_10405 [Leptospiraceae bacterium]|nr:hypothetical protein [Leptospiraceae bacterium]
MNSVLISYETIDVSFLAQDQAGSKKDYLICTMQLFCFVRWHFLAAFVDM